MHTQLPPRFDLIDYINKNFDKVFFSTEPGIMDLKRINEYEVIWFYIITGANPQRYKSHQWYDLTKWLRQNGVKEPKIVLQADYWAGKRHEIPKRIKNGLNYIDGLIHAGNRNWRVPVPVFYQQAPVKPIPDSIKWTPYEEKKKRAVAITRAYGGRGQNEEIAKKFGYNPITLGSNTKRKKRLEYLQYLADSLISFDYNEDYWGWSRMIMESTLVGTPVLGDDFRKGMKVCYPELLQMDKPKPDELPEHDPSKARFDNVKRKSYRQELKEFLANKEQYETTRQLGLKRLKEHLSQEACEKRIKKMLSYFSDNI